MIAVSLVVLGVATVGCKKPAGGGGAGTGTAAAPLAPVPHMTFPGTAEGAKQAAMEFLKPNVNLVTTARSLKPDAADYTTVFTGDAGPKVQKFFDPAWERGQLAIKIIPGQTELLINGATVEELKTGTGKSASCPAAWKDIVDQLNPSITVYCFKFVKPGETLGMTYDGLIFVNGHWAMFPKPFKALRPAAAAGATTGGTGP
jgi:hypothetical protein